MKKLRTIFSTIFFIQLGLAHAQPTSTEKFKVGVIAPLSGPLAEYGIAAKNGIEIAIAENPELYSNIEFIYEDSQWVPKNAVSAFDKLKSLNNVSLVMNWGNPTTEALAPIAEVSKMPLIGMTLDPEVGKGKKFVVRSTNASAEFSTLLAKYLTNKGYKKIGVVIAENTYVQGLFDGLSKELSSETEIGIIDRYNMSENSFRSTVSKIRTKKYDAIGVFLISGQASAFYRQLAEQKISVPTFGTDFFESTSEIKDAKGGMNGAVYPHLGTSGDFRNKYIKTYGNDYQIAYAGNWHDMALVIGNLFNKTPNASNDEIMSKLRLPNIYNGVCGDFKFIDSESGGPHFSFPIKMKKIDNLSITEINDG